MRKERERYEETPLYRIRHSMAHVMAQAVVDYFDGENVKLAIGPPIENGFYYDFELPRQLSPDDFEAIENRMREIIKEDQAFVRREVSADEARAEFADQPYKLELVEGLEQGGVDENGEPIDEAPVISFYTNGPFTDLCRGPHVESTGKLHRKAFKLMSVAGAYWRGDEKRPMLQRIYGTAFAQPAELKAHLRALEEARQRDHRKLGAELGIFTFSQEVGKGLPLWLPAGAELRDTLERFLRDEQLRRGYQPVVSPHIGKRELYERSGHWQTYRDSMYAPIDVDDEQFILKPMNCPHHVHIFKSMPHSYRDLPYRVFEFGTVYRYENSGNLHGLTRVRGFTQDDSHLFVTPEQLEAEFQGVVDLALHVFNSAGLEGFEARVGLRDSKSDKYIGDPAVWDKAQAAIIKAVEDRDMDYYVEEGEAAFYGPKLDFVFRDSIGREWQLGTVQVDYNLPERFELEYIGEDNQPHQPIMIHRALFGSMERFIGILIEHYGGAFPVWISPVQAVVIPITDRHVDHCRDVARALKAARIRAEVDERPDRMNAKIRDAQKRKVPYMLIVGDREMEANGAAVRLRSGEDLGTMALADVQAHIAGAIDSRK